MPNRLWVLLILLTLSLGSNRSHADPTLPSVSVDVQKKTVSTFAINMQEDYPHLAFVKPVFTAAAYSTFYTFYHCSTCDPTSAPSYFVHAPVNSWSTSSTAPNLINALQTLGFPQDKLSTISDVTVHKNDLYFENGSRKYSTLVFFHNEYVSMDEYRNMLLFLQNGGNVLIMNGNAFFAEVDYNAIDNRVILVDGHSWTFDGQNGTKSVMYRRFLEDLQSPKNINGIGSEYCRFRKGSTSGAIFNISNSNPHPLAQRMIDLGITRMAPNYISHEENCLTTPIAHIIADWKTSFDQPYRGIKIYETFPGGILGGSLIHFGFFGTDSFTWSSKVYETVKEAALYQYRGADTPWIRAPMDGSVFNKPFMIDFTQGWKTMVSLNGTEIPSAHRYSTFHLSDGNYNLTVEFRRGQAHYTRSVRFTVDTKDPAPILDYAIKNGNLSRFNVRMNDTNPSMISVLYYNQNMVHGSRTSIMPTHGILQHNLTLTDLNRINTSTTMMRIEMLDSAGNYNISWFHFEKDNQSGVLARIKMVQPLFQQLDYQTGYVDIPAVPQDFRPYLEISPDFGKTWVKHEFHTLNNSILRSNFTRDTNHFWYRVSLNYQGSFLTYYPMIRSYSWDSSLVQISSLNYQFNDTNFQVNASIISDRATNNSIQAELKGGNGTAMSELQFTDMQPHELNLMMNYSDGEYTLQLHIINEMGEFTRRISLQFSSGNVSSADFSIGNGDYIIMKNDFKRLGVSKFLVNWNHSRWEYDRAEVDTVTITAQNTTINVTGYDIFNQTIVNWSIHFTKFGNGLQFHISTNTANNIEMERSTANFSYFIDSNQAWSVSITQNTTQLAAAKGSNSAKLVIGFDGLTYGKSSFTIDFTCPSNKVSFDIVITRINPSPPTETTSSSSSMTTKPSTTRTPITSPTTSTKSSQQPVMNGTSKNNVGLDMMMVIPLVLLTMSVYWYRRKAAI